LADALWAVADVTVGEEEVPHLTMTLRPGGRVSGRIVFDATSLAPPANLTVVQLRLVDASGGVSAGLVGAVRADGTFEIVGVPPGTYSLASLWPEPDWWLRSAAMAGRDLLDTPIAVSGEEIGGLVVTFSDRRTELSGTLDRASNVPAPEHVIVVVPADRAYWRGASRRVQFTRPSTDGRFVFRDLPSGDYLLAALSDLDPADLTDRTFMEQLVHAAVPIALADGERKIQNVRVAP
jgi:hypothetical protein